MSVIHPKRSSGLSSSPDEGAFTLVEIMVTMTIVALLASLSMPQVKKATQSARASVVANDLKVFYTAFGTYAQQNGAYPPEAAVGVMPPLMVNQLAKSSWQRKTPIGGLYNWDFNRNHGGTVYRAAIAITRSGTNTVTTDNAQLLAIDRRIDDGNLNTGNFRLGAASEPVYIIER
ncbi:MAG TPA: prepilin-type N-terminal cleavage/methylation domain-containing protein [Opitutaceae bacterium]|nr:prepilin-type N-terminal cleavage/methylation domain-containing protein [Opitutaceae bacterium]